MVRVAVLTPRGRSDGAHRWQATRGTPVREVTLAGSYDDGATSCETKVRHVGDDWVAEIPPGSVAGGFVSLRVSATGTDGNKVEEWITAHIACDDPIRAQHGGPSGNRAEPDR
jgi:hypothetical protein